MEKRELRRRLSNRRRLEAGRASDFIKHAPNELRPGDLVILCCRVSEHTQDHNGNLQNQEANLRHRAEQLGATVIDVIRHVGSGTDPFWLARALKKAKQCGAKFFGETTDRLIRHPEYHSEKNSKVQARDTDLQDLQWWTKGVTLVTDVHPNALPDEVRSYQTKRGQRFKGNRGGRPKNIDGNRRGRPEIIKDQRELLDAVLRLMRTLPPRTG